MIPLRDNVPTRSFLQETVPWFREADVGVVQTPHVFRNPDIFQRAFRLEGRIPNEADLFNRGYSTLVQIESILGLVAPSSLAPSPVH